MSSDLPHIPRLYVEGGLQAGQPINAGPGQAHYLKNVMRLKAGDTLRLFNGRDGEWRGAIAAGNAAKAAKHSMTIAVNAQSRPQTAIPDLWLCCAPIKKAHFDFMIEKATELGVSTIQPVLTSRTQVREVNTGRCHALAVEAAEQSERLSVPAMREPATLHDLAAGWPAGRALIVCAERGEALPAREAFALPRLKAAAAAAIMTGPEGGFAEEELDLLRRIESAVFIRLGPRILRADTAAIAALSLWQELCGDWNLEAGD